MDEVKTYAVLWDMDGTLVDTAELHYQAWTALTQEMRLPFTRADFDATFGWRNPDIIRKLFGHRYTAGQVAEIGSRKEDYYRAAARHGISLLPGARALLRDLHEHGYRQAIGSSAPRQNLDLILELTQAAPFFQAVVAMEDTQRGKPDPQVFLIAAEKLGVPAARCLVIEDAVVGVQAANAGGMKCIAVSSGGHHPPDRLKEAGADLVVASLEEVSERAVCQILKAY
jgi:beta-phosphoglucomutase